MDAMTRPLDLPERFRAMRSQEDTAYACPDYLETLTTPPPDPAAPAAPRSGVNEVWREKICEWSYQVVDHFDFNREVVAISLSYLDRFLATRRCNRKVFQLAAMTTLYLAIKLNEPRTLKMGSLVELSRGYFTAEHIAAMEEAILRALEWRMHPPTSLAFIRHYLTLLPPDAARNGTWHDIMEMSRFLTELSVCDYFFVNHPPSAIGLAAVLNSLDGLDEHRLTPVQRETFLAEITSHSGLRHDAPAVTEVRTMLRQMYHQSTGNDPADDLPDADDRFRPVEDRFDAESPVFVGQIGASAAFPEHAAYDRHGAEDPPHPGPPGRADAHAARKTSKTASRTRPGGNS